MGLIDEVSHFLVAQYRRNRDPQVTQAALDWFAARVGEDNVDKLLRTFVQEFPNVAVYRGETTIDEWLQGSSDGLAHREAVLEELMLLWLANQNPAFRSFPRALRRYEARRKHGLQAGHCGARQLFRHPPRHRHGSRQSPRPPPRTHGSLARLAQRPARLDSRKLVAVSRRKPPQSSPRRRRSQEEESPSGCASIPARVTVTTIPSATRTTPMSPTSAVTPATSNTSASSPDQDWMPNVVMIAKSTYVWLAQLSRQYGRAIERLDQIPDEALETLAHRGLNALWLIGVWERSRASQAIKRMRGSRTPSPPPIPSSNTTSPATSAATTPTTISASAPPRYGIRLASDMVPKPHGHRFPLGHRAS